MPALKYKDPDTGTWKVVPNNVIVTGGGGGDGEPIVVAGNATQYYRGDKTWQALDWAAVSAKPLTFTPTIGATSVTAVAGNDIRLTDARVPLAHNQAASTITDSTAVGRSVLTAVDAAAARVVLGAGTSSLAIGTTSTTAAAGNDARLSDARTPTAHTHVVSNLSDATTLGKSFLTTSTDPTAARGILGAEAAITTGGAGKYWDGTKSWQVLDKAAVGLSNVDDSKDEWKWVAAAGRLSSDYKINGVVFNATQDITVPVPESVFPRTWHDILAFGTINGWPSFETRVGSTWSAATLNKSVFDGLDSSYADLIPESGTIDGCRYTWNSSMLPWSQFEHMVMILNNSGGAARTLVYTLQHSDDGVAWTDFGTITSPDWSVTLDLPTSWAWGGWQYMRLLITRSSGTGGLRMTSIAAYTRRMGDQGGGRETEVPYGWDADQVITFRANPLLPSNPTNNAHATRKDWVLAQIAAGGGGGGATDWSQMPVAMPGPESMPDAPGGDVGGVRLTGLYNGNIDRNDPFYSYTFVTNGGDEDMPLTVPTLAILFNVFVQWTNVDAEHTAPIVKEALDTPILASLDKADTAVQTDDPRLTDARTPTAHFHVPRVSSVTNQTSWTINSATTDFAENTGLTGAVTINNPTGTPSQGQRLWITLTGTAARAISYGTAFEDSTVIRPTTTTGTATLDIGFRWNSATSKWRCIAWG